MSLLQQVFQCKNLPGYIKRAQRVSEIIQPWIVTGDRVLDFGCGNLLIGRTLQNNIDVQVIGVDVIDVNNTDLPLTVYNGDVIPFDNNSFDVTYAAFMLHHTTNIYTLISECARVTKRRILILEDIYINKFELLVMKFLDHVNLFTSTDMNIPMNFKKESEWLSLLERPGWKLVKSKKIRPVALRPTRHRLFVIDFLENQQSFLSPPV
jgi:ubiquinone/menaquinone biosynthesis C-methylase UbiE